MNGAEVLMPSFQPGNGYLLLDSITAGRTMVMVGTVGALSISSSGTA